MDALSEYWAVTSVILWQWAIWLQFNCSQVLSSDSTKTEMKLCLAAVLHFITFSYNEN